MAVRLVVDDYANRHNALKKLVAKEGVVESQSWVVRWSGVCSALGLGISLFAGGAFAEAWGAGVTPVYAPDFEPGSVQAVKLTECNMTPGMVYWAGGQASASCAGYDISLASISKTNKHAEEESEAGTHVVIKLQEKGKAAAKAVLKMASFPGGEFVDLAYSADLNGDGKPDFVIETSSHGNGLAGEFGGRLFLLSSDDGYRYLSKSGVMSDSRIVRFANESAATLILQRIAEPAGPDGPTAVLSRDGKEHSYFIFDLVQFDPASPKGAKLNNSQDARFPFWAQYTNKPQKSETTLLTPARKKALWHDPVASAAAGKLVAR
ncbi:hypothetical protein OYT1_ch0897 [Ferriphaselus amnicola]|uniref:FG-GAP repeat protein n=1 Tax=Ferriphaselus amnicola TaxID=1188319 RepID=A0A2Z6GAI7_9PROT|nr:hypothetical protein [Ferriphaselus amnicola]BBE50460.1 hypothetical protein OYT1_ch0897 [Ferriphaselus amnicola]